MKPKDDVREWLDTRCGRHVSVETQMVNATVAPLVNEGPLSKWGTLNPEIVDASEEPIHFRDLYQVGAASYNLADLPDNIDVKIRTEPAEQLEMTFDDGTSQLITVRITVVREEGRE
ncbi:MAG: hypothetical protein WBW80_09825 [Acidimicrobiales bacterium]